MFKTRGLTLDLCRVLSKWVRVSVRVYRRFGFRLGFIVGLCPRVLVEWPLLCAAKPQQICSNVVLGL